MKTARQKLTPPEVARIWGVSADKILGWIRSGELRAIDASQSRGQRPRFLIDVKDLDDFESRRSVVSSLKKPTQRHRRDHKVTEYF